VTGRHHRGTPLIRLLVRLGWQRDPANWTVPCRDLDGRRARLLIRLAPTGITITPTVPGPLRLTGLQVGQLRHATRDAVFTGGLLADPDQAEPARRSWRTEAPPGPRDKLPLQREVIHLIPAAPRPTVWELCQKMNQTHMNQVVGDLARRTWMNSRIHSGWSGQARAETITPSTTAAPFTNSAPAAVTSGSSAG
jgi:hypothetical protein